MLAGGIGSRFWPASTPRRPKQFMPLASSRPLIEDTLERAYAIAASSRVLIVAGGHLRDVIAEYLPDFPTDQLLVEPEARGTAPALAWAAVEIERRASDPARAVMIAMPSDHVIQPLNRFVATLERAITAAGDLGSLITLGIRPSRPETAYGYIEVGPATKAEAFEVARFVEKPDMERARKYVEAGRFLWNSGIFVWRPGTLLDELRTHTPEIAAELERLESGDVPGFFAMMPKNLTIDYGLLERSSKIAVVEAEFDWDDLGAWKAILRLRETDARGNIVVGDGVARDCDGCIIWAEDGPVVVWGVENMIVARAGGITFVAPIERTGELKQLIEDLPGELKKGDA